jgi:serine/threonine protein kinase
VLIFDLISGVPRYLIAVAGLWLCLKSDVSANSVSKTHEHVSERHMCPGQTFLKQYIHVSNLRHLHKRTYHATVHYPHQSTSTSSHILHTIIMSPFTYDIIEKTKVLTLAHKTVCNGRYYLEKKIGRGGYSIVYLATDLHDPSRKRKVAIKCMLEKRKENSGREIALQRHAARYIPGVVNIYESFMERNLFFIVLEYCPGGNVFSAIEEKRMFVGREDRIRSTFIQMVDIIIRIHSLGIFHRDLKPENFLLDADMTTVRLADFGLATTTEYSMRFGCGSYSYMTPECLVGGYNPRVQYYSSRAADIWALAIILINLTTDRNPWAQATMDDSCYASFTKDPGFLSKMLPLSPGLESMLNGVLKRHGTNTNLRNLRKSFRVLGRLYMTREELAGAHKYAQEVGSACRLDVDVAPKRSRAQNQKRGNEGEREKGRQQRRVQRPALRRDNINVSDGLGLTNGDSSTESNGPVTPESKPVRSKKPLFSKHLKGPWILMPNQKDAFCWKFGNTKVTSIGVMDDIPEIAI